MTLREKCREALDKLFIENLSGARVVLDAIGPLLDAADAQLSEANALLDKELFDAKQRERAEIAESQRDHALAENALLRGALITCAAISGQYGGGGGSNSRVRKESDAAVAKANAALDSAPLAEAAARVLKAAKELLELRMRPPVVTSVDDFVAAADRVCDSYDALRALQGSKEAT